MRRTRRKAIAPALPEFLEELARAVRGGHSLRSALAICQHKTVEPLRGDLAVVVARLDAGVPLEAALHEWMETRERVPAVQLVGVALCMAAAAGGSVARAVDGVADTTRSELDVQAEVRALASQAQASALLVAALPLVFALVAGSTDPQTLTFLINTRLGVVCLVAGGALDIVGWFWMRRITGSIAL